MDEFTLVFSIRPQWVTQILEGLKTCELRRRPPKLDTPVSALIYETSPARQVRAKCVVGPVVSDAPERLWKRFGSSACVSRDEFDSYFAGLSQAHAIMIQAVEELPKPLSLELLRQKVGFSPPRAWNRASRPLLQVIRAS
jgi:predicted transcriptional regulator